MNNQQFRQEIEQELHTLLQWWMDHMVDGENGGFYGRMDGYSQLHPKANKGVILNTRLLWTFSAADHTGNAAYRKMADRAYQYLLDHFWDGQHGGVFWSVNYQGECTDATKQIYAQAFAIYALTAYYAVSRQQAALDKAFKLFSLLEEHSRDKEKGGYLNVFSADWQMAADQRLSEKDEDQVKIMNTHLHVMEAYANLHRVAGNEATSEALRYTIRIILDKFCTRTPRHLYLFFDDNWQPTSEERSFGHDIECAWLLREAAEILGDENLMKEVNPVALELAQSTLERGLDPNGGIYEKTDPSGQHPELEKHWWPQAEAIVGFLDMYALTEDQRFQEAALDSWVYIKQYFRDPKHGEWHWLIDANGQPILDKEDKAGPWKAPYHSVRMCLEVLSRFESMKAQYH